jgi:hypothetical protein
MRWVVRGTLHAKAKMRHMLGEVINREEKSGRLGSEIAGLFVKEGLDSDIPELRGYDIEMPVFGTSADGNE